jgi:UDP-glucuronate 4-epimerase
MIAGGQKAPVYGYGEVKRDFTYISDVVDGIIRTLLVPLSYDLFNLGSAEATSVNRLVELISKELGKKPVLVPSPLPPGDTPATLADLSHSRRVLGYTPKVSLAEGIKRFIAWFVRQGTVPCLE